MSRIIKDLNSLTGGINFGGVNDIKNVTITANTNDLLIPDLQGFTLIRVETTGNFSLTGLVPYDITLAIWVLLFNVGTNNLNIDNNSGSSSANNRFLIGTQKTLQADEGLALVYDPASLRWRSFGINI